MEVLEPWRGVVCLNRQVALLPLFGQDTHSHGEVYFSVAVDSSLSLCLHLSPPPREPPGDRISRVGRERLSPGKSSRAF